MHRMEERAGLQRRIAELAARHVVEDGADLERAKRKAAAQILGDGARAAGALPDRDQLDAALREHLRSFGGAAHRAWLQRRRTLALQWMRTLARFTPRLVGAVLDASATPGTSIELEVFADSPKDVEMVLLEAGIDYRAEAPASGRRHEHQRIGFYADADDSGGVGPRAAAISWRGVPILLIVCDPSARRGGKAGRRGAEDRALHPVERAGWADADSLSRLLAETGDAAASALADDD